MNLNYNLKSGYFIVKINFKAMIIGILLVATLIAINTYETAFAADNSTGALNDKGYALNKLGKQNEGLYSLKVYFLIVTIYKHFQPIL